MVKSEMAIIAIGGINMGKVALRVLAMMMVLSLGPPRLRRPPGAEGIMSMQTATVSVLPSLGIFQKMLDKLAKKGYH